MKFLLNKLSKFVVPYDTKLFYESKFGFAYEMKKSFFCKNKNFLCYKIFENLEILNFYNIKFAKKGLNINKF